MAVHEMSTAFRVCIWWKDLLFFILLTVLTYPLFQAPSNSLRERERRELSVKHYNGEITAMQAAKKYVCTQSKFLIALGRAVCFYVLFMRFLACFSTHALCPHLHWFCLYFTVIHCFYWYYRHAHLMRLVLTHTHVLSHPLHGHWRLPFSNDNFVTFIKLPTAAISLQFRNAKRYKANPHRLAMEERLMQLRRRDILDDTELRHLFKGWNCTSLFFILFYNHITLILLTLCYISHFPPIFNFYFYYK